jgi:hypothetical protein
MSEQEYEIITENKYNAIAGEGKITIAGLSFIVSHCKRILKALSTLRLIHIKL